MIKKIKNSIFMLGMIILSFPSFSQQYSLRDIQRLVNKNQFDDAIFYLKEYNSIYNILSDEQKTLYHLLLADSSVNKYYQNIEQDSFRNIAIQSINAVEELEVKNKVSKFSRDAQVLKNDLLSYLVNRGITETKTNALVKASRTFQQAYLLNKKDTIYLYQSAGLALNAKDEAFAIDRYKELINLNYNGTTKIFVATNTVTGGVDSFGNDEKSRDQAVKSGVYENPQTIQEKSKRADIYKNLATILINQNNFSQGEAYAIKAYELNPQDLNLVITLFNMYMQTNRLFKFQEYKDKALTTFPDNPQLLYNIGVVYFNLKYTALAKEYFEKGLALSPQDYNINKALGSLLLDEDAKITKQLNNLADNKTNKTKRDNLNEMKKKNYLEILKYFEKAYSENSNDEGLRKIIQELKEYK